MRHLRLDYAQARAVPFSLPALRLASVLITPLSAAYFFFRAFPLAIPASRARSFFSAAVSLAEPFLPPFDPNLRNCSFISAGNFMLE
jgi:hypothetical protein